MDAMQLLFTGIACLFFTGIWATENDTIEKWSYHFQFTGIAQGHAAFHASYSGDNSLNQEQEKAFSVTSTLFLGRKLWKGASFYLNPEVAGGKGISSALGIAGFTNGECFRIGDPSPAIYLARAFLRQHLAIGNEMHNATAAANQLGGESTPESRVTITAGRFSIADVYDDNSYSHDPRTQFMNWALMSNGAWDYPANTRGYTYGIIMELVKPGWAVRFSETMLPKTANGSVMDENIRKARGETLELERDFTIADHKAVIRFLGFRNLSRAGNYKHAIDLYHSIADTSLDVNTLTTYNGQKYGVALNAELELNNNTGVFARASWNDGKTATWVFTEIDASASIGIQIKGSKWKRPTDVIGIAGVMNGISNDHRNFLNTGGYGFLIGDGKLPDYGAETIGEIYYSLQLTNSFWVSADYQYVQNPAYNKDRGPVHVYAIRGHVEF
jgi:high affinity Mn2+ porin